MIRALRVAAATGPHLLAGGLVLALAGSVAPAASASLFRTLIDSIQQSGSLGAVLPAAVVVSFAGALAVLLPAASDLLARRLTGFMKVREHDELFRSVNRHDDMAVFDDPEFHSQLTLARERGIDASGEVVAGGLLFTQSAMLGLGFFGLLLSTYPPLAACAAVVAVPVVMIELSLGKVRLASAKELNSYSRERFLYSQAMAGHREAKEVRLLGIGDFLRGRARTQFEKAIDAEHRLARREFSMHLAATSLGLGLSLGMLVWAIVRYRAGSLSLGDLTVVASAGAGIIQGLSGSVAHLGRVHHALDVQGVLKDLLAIDGPVGLSTLVPAGEAPPLTEGVEFAGVSFRYPGQPSRAVDGVDLRIGADQMVAMVGANGSGKTTLAKLACRLYEPARGAVLWNGVDARAFTHESLRRRVGVLFQDFVIYEFSVSDNIGIGDVAQIGCLRAVQSSAVSSGADAVIDALPRGYATRLTRMFPDPEDEAASGVVLSGGQAQRVSIARLLMRSNADLLILDEPTSGLDPAAEAELLETLRRSRAGKATVFVTHRLGAARNADLIVVVAGGTVVEQGSHEDLIARDGEYARLYQLQAAGYEDVPG